MHAFRRLIGVSLIAGTLSGLIWFGLQYVTVIPLIEAAEKYEAAASHDDETHAAPLSRNSLTALTTVLTGIGFASLLFGVASLAGERLQVKSGALWGVAAFVCVSAVPSLGLPPQPPGSAVADLASRQMWWFGTVLATAVGLYCIARSGRRPARLLAGIACLLLPHWIGAPVTFEPGMVPATLVRQFEIASLATTAVFWLTLGTVGGFLNCRRPLPRPKKP